MYHKIARSHNSFVRRKPRRFSTDYLLECAVSKRSSKPSKKGKVSFLTIGGLMPVVNEFLMEIHFGLMIPTISFWSLFVTACTPSKSSASNNVPLRRNT